MLERLLFRAITVAFFILANSFFVAAEFALVSVRETRIEQMLALGRPGARTALALKHNIEEFLPAVQFGVTLASLGLGWIGEPVVAGILENALHNTAWLQNVPSLHIAVASHAVAVVLAFAFITYFDVLLGELVPKSLALQRAERIALAVAGPMDVFIRITRPAVRFMNVSASAVLRLFHAPLRGEANVHSPEELKLIATATRRMGLLPAFQEEIIHRAIELNHVTVREVMTPRGNIFALPADMPLEEASARVIEEQHSRVPVYDPERGPEHIIGVIYSKDISRLMHFRVSAHAGDPERAMQSPFIDLRLRQVLREIMVVPETKLVVDLLQEFQERRRQIAIVVDEFGSTAGLVTAEDALEQIVGEMEDEFDVASKTMLTTGGMVVLDGSVTLRDLVTQMRWKMPREAGVETLAGFLLAQLGHIPRKGEFVNYGGRRFTVEEMSGNRIHRVRVEEIAAPPAKAAGASKKEAKL
jgi:CBS domain containing-hemolysin-like protein